MWMFSVQEELSVFNHFIVNISCLQLYNAIILFPNRSADKIADLLERVEIDSSLNAQLMESVDHILSANISSGFLRIWTASESCHGAIDN